MKTAILVILLIAVSGFFYYCEYNQDVKTRNGFWTVMPDFAKTAGIETMVLYSKSGDGYLYLHTDELIHNEPVKLIFSPNYMTIPLQTSRGKLCIIGDTIDKIFTYSLDKINNILVINDGDMIFGILYRDPDMTLADISHSDTITI